ncbi:hypothetical protein GEMRC1_011318 [Eukaryota sp. GEM-RC1]
MTSIKDDDDGYSTMTIIANFDSNVWMLDAQISEDDSSFRMAFFSEGPDLYIVNDVCARENPEFLEEIGFESVNKMKVDPDVHEQVGQLDYQGSKCDLYNVDPAEDLYVCLYDGFIAIACDGGLDLTENCHVFTDHEELSSSDARFSLEHHCSSIQKTAFNAKLFVYDTNVDLLNLKMTLYDGDSYVLFTRDHMYEFEYEQCTVDDADDEILQILPSMKINVFTNNTHETKEVLGQTCTIFRTDYSEDFTVDLCIHDGFVFEQCMQALDFCLQFSDHQEISADDPSFTPPEYCEIPESSHQELYFVATLERRNETINDAYFYLNSSVLWWEDAGEENLLTGVDLYSLAGTTCSKSIDGDLADFINHLIVPSRGFHFVDDDVIGELSCKRYIYEYNWGDEITNCITEDGFVLEFCEEDWNTGEVECSYLTDHSIITADDPAFTPPQHCEIPELPSQELYFAATLEREGETFENVHFNLDLGLLWREVADKQDLVNLIRRYRFDESTCTEHFDWDLIGFLRHLVMPSEVNVFAGYDVIGGVACNRYEYFNYAGEDISSCITEDGFVLELCEENYLTKEMECSYMKEHSVISADDSKFELPSHC